MPQLSPRKSLNKAFLKMKPLREDVQGFSESVKQYVRRVEASFGESEEYHKNLSREHLLQKVIRGPKGERYDINTSGRADLVIRGGSTSRSDVKVLLEYKSPSNDAEMPREGRLNCETIRVPQLNHLCKGALSGSFFMKINGHFAQTLSISKYPIVEPSSSDKEVLDRLVGVRMGLDVHSAGGVAEIERVEGEIEGGVGRIYLQ